MIKISVKGLAKFMTATAAQQRKILRDYKFPDDEGVAQAAYYREARDLISEYHRQGHPTEWLRSKAAVLQTLASAMPGRGATRLRHNARAIEEYATNFPAKQYEVLAERKYFLEYGPVRVSVVPDLHMREQGRERLFKLEFSKTEPSAETVRIVSQLMFEAAIQAKLLVKSKDVLYVDVGRGKRHSGARVGARMRTEIEAACTNISAMWDGIKP